MKLVAPPWTAEDLAEIRGELDRGATWREIGAARGMSSATAHTRWARAREAAALGQLAAPAAPDSPPPPDVDSAGRIVRTEDDAGVTIEAPSSASIRTLDDLLAYAAVDLSVWRVEWHVVNVWEALARGPDGTNVVRPLHQVKARLAPIAPVIDARAVIADMIEDAARYAPAYRAPARGRAAAGPGLLLEIGIPDLHLGMLAWGEEAGADYDTAIARDLFLAVIDLLVRRASGFPVERIVLPVGNDLLHVDRTIEGKGGATTRGTPQDVDTRWQKAFRTAREMLVQALDGLRLVAPVDVVVVPGNHDTERTWMLGEVLRAWYRADAEVTIDNSVAPRKYVRFGGVLLGYAHGHSERRADLPLIMAQERPEDWAACCYRAWKLGHRHARRVTERQVMDDVAGVPVFTLASLAARDSWHAHRGYIHDRRAEASLYNPTSGPVATLYAGAEEVG